MPVGIILRPGHLVEPFYLYEEVMRRYGSALEILNITPEAWDNRFIRNSDRALNEIRTIIGGYTSDAGEDIKGDLMEYYYWISARRWFWFSLFDGKNPITLKGRYTWDNLKERFYTYKYNPPPESMANVFGWLVYFGRLGAMLYTNEIIEPGTGFYTVPGSVTAQQIEDMQSMFRPGKPPGFLDTAIIAFIKIGTLYALAEGVGLLAPEDSFIDEIAEATTTSIEEIFNTENLVQLGLDVVSDTVDDQLQTIRRDVLDDLEQIDDDTVLNLSALTDQIGNITRDLIDSVTGTIQASDTAILNFINTRLESIERNIAPAEAQAIEIDKDSSRLGGLSVAVGLSKLLFKVKQ